jgi:hypothetical protein
MIPENPLLIIHLTDSGILIRKQVEASPILDEEAKREQ